MFKATEAKLPTTLAHSLSKASGIKFHQEQSIDHFNKLSSHFIRSKIQLALHSHRMLFAQLAEHRLAEHRRQEHRWWSMRGCAHRWRLMGSCCVLSSRHVNLLLNSLG